MIEIKALASGSSGNCYHITDGKTPLLIEAGISIDRIRHGVDFKLSEVAGCLISHAHMDHAKSVKKLMEAGIDCWMHPATANELGIISHRLQFITPRYSFQEPVIINTWSIMCFALNHDCEGALGFHLLSSNGDCLLYITDTAYVGPRFKGITHLMIECNFDEDLIRENVASGEVDKAVKRRVYANHLSLDRVVSFLQANDLSQLREVHLLHLSDSNSDEEAFKVAIQQIVGVPVYVH